MTLTELFEAVEEGKITEHQFEIIVENAEYAHWQDGLLD